MADDVSLKEYLERRLEDINARILERFRLNDEAIAKAERTMNTRLDSMNEFRDALRDQASRMATRAELDTLRETVNELRRDKANLDGRMAIVAFVTALIVTGVAEVVTRLFGH